MTSSRMYPLSSETFDKHILPIIESSKKVSGRPTCIPHYDFFCAVLYVLKTGLSWRDVPKEYGAWHTIYTRYKRWSETGLFWTILQTLQSQKAIQLDVCWVDSTTIPLHRHGSGPLKKKAVNRQAVGEKA